MVYYVYLYMTYAYLRFEGVVLIRIFVVEGHLRVVHVGELDAAVVHRVGAQDGGDEDPREGHPCARHVEGEVRRDLAHAHEGEVQEWCQLRRHLRAGIRRVVEYPALLLHLREVAQLRPQLGG